MTPQELFLLIDTAFEKNGKQAFSDMLAFLHEQRTKDQCIVKPLLAAMSDTENALMERSVFCITEMVNCYLNTKLVGMDCFSMATLDRPWDNNKNTRYSALCVRMKDGKTLHLIKDSDEFKKIESFFPSSDKETIHQMMEVARAVDYDWEQYKDKSLHTIFSQDDVFFGMERFCDYYGQDIDLLMPFLEKISLRGATETRKDAKLPLVGRKM